MRKLDWMTVTGLVMGFSLTFTAIAIGGSVRGYIDIASILITFAGSFSALIISYHFDQIKGAFSTAKVAFYVRETKLSALIKIFIDLSGKARREGLLALEEEMEHLEDPFFQRGLQMVVDGVEPEVIRDVLETEMACVEERHAEGQGIFRTWGEYGPAFGMLGTLIGLVQMLRDLNDPSKIGPAMAIALLTTLYGVILANLVCIPIANKLSLNSKKEMLEKEVILEGILAIQSGVNPRMIEDKLKSLLSPKERKIQEEGLYRSNEKGVTFDAS